MKTLLRLSLISITLFKQCRELLAQLPSVHVLLEPERFRRFGSAALKAQNFRPSLGGFNIMTNLKMMKVVDGC